LRRDLVGARMRLRRERGAEAASRPPRRRPTSSPTARPKKVSTPSPADRSTRWRVSGRRKEGPRFKATSIESRTAPGHLGRHGACGANTYLNELASAHAQDRTAGLYLASDGDRGGETKAKVGSRGRGVRRCALRDSDAVAVQGGVAGRTRRVPTKDVGFLPRITAAMVGSGGGGRRAIAAPAVWRELCGATGHEAGITSHPGTEVRGAMGATFVDEKQQQRPIGYGCYGIGVCRGSSTTHREATR